MQQIQTNLSPDELKMLIREAVRDVLVELLGEDASSEPKFTPEIAARLAQYRDTKPIGVDVDGVVKELGLDNKTSHV